MPPIGGDKREVNEFAQANGFDITSGNAFGESMGRR
jgi:hypothetical protein